MFLCYFFGLRVHALFSSLSFCFQYQCNWLPGKIRPRNDLYVLSGMLNLTKLKLKPLNSLLRICTWCIWKLEKRLSSWRRTLYKSISVERNRLENEEDGLKISRMHRVRYSRGCANYWRQTPMAWYSANPPGKGMHQTTTTKNRQPYLLSTAFELEIPSSCLDDKTTCNCILY